MDERKLLFENDYLGLYSDGTIGISDGVGYIDTIEKDETIKFYLQLKYYYEVLQYTNQSTQYKKDPKNSRYI